MTGLRWPAAMLSILGLIGPFAAGQDGGPGEPPSRETLTYQIEWRLIPAGNAKLTWNPAPRSGATPSELRLHLESAGLVSRLFRVDDDYTASLGQNLCAQNTLLVAREGSRNKETRVTYDTPARKALYTEKDLNKNTTVTHDVEIPPCVHDVLGGLLMLRTLRLEPGKTVQIPVSDGKKFVQVKIESVRREDLNTAMGPRKTIRYEVFIFNNVLYKRTGRLNIWLTDDNSRLPVQLQVRLQFTIGTITFKLEKEEKS
ncbi:MAG TPA: DUF3108 domain-containing protein [Bryobacteraceae bacterium]|jgi:hypothetical protein|nr:DUF3108 domain-containing protein [Bryobacteraceae bacterium]